jgi:hypothetical protein
MKLSILDMGGGSVPLNALLAERLQTENGKRLVNIFCSLHTIGKKNSNFQTRNFLTAPY